MGISRMLRSSNPEVVKEYLGYIDFYNEKLMEETAAKYGSDSPNFDKMYRKAIKKNAKDMGAF